MSYIPFAERPTLSEKEKQHIVQIAAPIAHLMQQLLAELELKKPALHRILCHTKTNRAFNPKRYYLKSVMSDMVLDSSRTPQTTFELLQLLQLIFSGLHHQNFKSLKQKIKRQEN